MIFHNIDFIKLISSPVKLKVVKFLCQHKADLSEREIASIVKVSHMSINRILRDLARVNFAYQAVIGAAHVWRVNRASYAFKTLDFFLNNNLLVGSPLNDFKQVVLKNLPRKLVLRVVLFGSIAKKTEKENSDIDLFVMVKDEKSKVNLDQWLEELSTKCLEVYGNRFAPYVLTVKEFKQKKDLDVIKDIEKGIEIYPYK